MDRTVKVQRNDSLGGILWIGGWLFSIGFLKLGFWKGALALIIWPFLLGEHFADTAPSAEGDVQIELRRT